jgi:hypothetical protein
MEVSMRKHSKEYTEPIFDRLADYRERLIAHPFLVEARTGQLPTPILHEFAFHQLSDSILWIPMLAQMHDKARSPRLRRAIADNISHEAGLHATSHVTLALAMARSLGISRLDAFPTDVITQTIELYLSEDLDEPAIAGWLLVAESLVPILFDAVIPAFARAGADTTYLSAHVAIDADEHAAWMTEAVEELAPDGSESIVVGMAEAWDETIRVPDRLWRARCASR